MSLHWLSMVSMRIGTVTALCSESSIFRRSYVQQIFIQKVLCSEGSMFRRSYSEIFLSKVLYSYSQKIIFSESPRHRPLCWK